MIFIDSEGNYPRFLGDLLLSYPDWKSNQDLPDGWNAVMDVEVVESQPGKRVVEVFPEIVNGVAYRKWELQDISKQDIERLEQIHKFSADRH